jgi:CheY-like chemotaxis protein
MQARIFELFVQADTSVERRQGGLGIGLTLVKTLVELHGGTVAAKSVGFGRGSEFEVRLPLFTPEALPAPLAGEGLVKPSLGRRIGLVEDSEDSRLVLAELLRLLGHEVFAVEDGPAALRLAAREAPEVFIVDIGLPGMDGYEVARALRGAPGGEKRLLIALTGYGSDEEKERAREAGFDAHLTKPAAIDELERLLS